MDGLGRLAMQCTDPRNVSEQDLDFASRTLTSSLHGMDIRPSFNYLNFLTLTGDIYPGKRSATVNKY